MEDLFEICGKKDHYTIDDAKKLHKQQWSNAEYQASLDMEVNGTRAISKEGMLSVLKLRSSYISQRGATLNNPHVTSNFLKSFIGTDRSINEDWAMKLKQIAKEYLLGNPNHPFG